MQELYAANPPMFKNHPLGFVLSILLIPLAVGILILLYWHLQNKSSRLSVTRDHVLYEKGLLSKERSEVDIDGIRSVKVKQSFANRIFGTGTIELYTSGDNPEIVAKGMPDPNKVREIIKANQKSE
jgi:uncharacterized membrane protein YdbT with pleckstrin-like domain